MTAEKELFKEVIEWPEFQRDFKKLLKKFRSLKEDFATFKKVSLKAYHKLGETNVGIVPVSDLGIQNPKIYKVKKFACRALRGRGAQSGMRIIYACFQDRDKIEFIEIYFKGDTENEDRERIKRLYGSVRSEIHPSADSQE